LQPSWKASPLLFLSIAVDSKVADTPTRRHADTPTRPHVSPDTGTFRSVAVPVVNIRHVNMTMPHWRVAMPMRMRLSWWIGRQMVV
jgi:hypothetical protein